MRGRAGPGSIRDRISTSRPESIPMSIRSTRATTTGLRSRSYGWYILVLLALANFFHYGNRNILFPMYEDLRTRFGFSNSELGMLGSAFMITHALMSLPFGWAGDRFDRQRVIAWGLVLWSAAAVASAAATGLGSLLIARALVGVGTAACVPVANALLCQVFEEDEKARTISLFNLGLFLGGAAGFGVGAGLGYPYGVLVMAVPGLLLAVLIARLEVPPRPLRDQGPSLTTFFRHAAELLRMPSVRWVMMGAVIMAFAAGGYASWFFEFLVKGKGLAKGTAFIIFGFSLIAGLMGVLAGGIVGDRLQRHRDYGRLAAICMGMGLTVPFALISLFAPVGPIFYVASWLTMFFITWYHGPIAAVVDDLARDDRATTAQALVIFVMHLVGTTPSSWIVGKLVDEVGLQKAMLVPTGGVLLAALVLTGGWRTVGGDRKGVRAG